VIFYILPFLVLEKIFKDFYFGEIIFKKPSKIQAITTANIREKSFF